jgi:hypothetical protein
MSWSQAGRWAQREVEHGAWRGWLVSGARRGRLCARELVEKARARRREGGQPGGWGGAGGVGAGLCAGLVSKVGGVCWAGAREGRRRAADGWCSWPGGGACERGGAMRRRSKAWHGI